MTRTLAEPTLTGRFFDYPATATGACRPYWLSTPGANRVRMTGACTRALLACFEGVIERAVVLANFGAISGFAPKTADYSTSAEPRCLVDLGAWGRATERAKFEWKFLRGCPAEEWAAFVSAAWRLWRAASRTISQGGYSVTVYAFQDGMFDFSTPGWIDDDENNVIYVVAESGDMGDTPSDSGVYSDEPIYAPWNTWHGYEGPNPSPANWCHDALVNLGRENLDYAGGGRQDTLADILDMADPHPLGTLADGHVGNWISASAGAASSATVRRSGAAWAVFQAMLANMAYSHLAFAWSALFHFAQVTREVVRAWTYDPDGDEFFLSDYLNADIPFQGDDTELVSWSTREFLHSACGVEFTIDFSDAEMEDLALAARPVDGYVTFDPRDYARTLTDSNTGLSSVQLQRAQTDYVHNVAADVPGVYPATPFASYANEFGNVTFVDRKATFSGGSTVTAHSVRGESGDEDLSSVVAGHCQWLVGQVPAPRGFPTISGINAAAVRAAQNNAWLGWRLYYPETPNWPANNPTRYAPVAVSGFGTNEQRTISWDSTDAVWRATGVGMVFGTFQLAFPDFPFGWTNDQRVTITPGHEALAAYEWLFKALPAPAA